MLFLYQVSSITQTSTTQVSNISQALTNLATETIDAIPSIILFVIIVIIGYIVAEIVSNIVGRVIRKEFARFSVNLDPSYIEGTVKALIIILSLAIALSILNLGAATVYISLIAKYLPYLAGAILLLTLGMSLVNVLLDYMARQMPVQDQFIAVILSVLRFGLYAVIITIAAELAIFEWLPSINSYLFYDILIGSIVLLFSFAITDKALDTIVKTDPNANYIATYGRFLLYTIFILIAVAIIVQPFGNVTSILQTLSWGLAIAFGILLVPLIYMFVKKMVAEIK
jgi:Conserved TM helix.